jgi:hypothetical protein
LFFVIAGCGPSQEAASVPRSSAADANDTFLRAHWARPLAAQGAVPDGYGALEGALDAKDCGICHVEQWGDWQRSLHARAMGPGITGQIVNLDSSARSEQQNCLRCHAPLAEQADSLEHAIGEFTNGDAQALDNGLHAQGVTCAACHVRGHQRFGPLRRDGTVPSESDRRKLPHGAWTASTAFEDARFCGACHQFDPDGFALNGKLIEDTVEEWRASAFASEGTTCQSCHMLDRRHLWRGIHDAEMVRRAVVIAVSPPKLDHGRVVATLRIRNVGAGHYFPTYVTPRVVAEIYQEASDGQILETTRVQRVIQREVALDLSREIDDSRLAPGAEAVLDYRRPLAPPATHLAYRVRVEPDAFYTAFYESLLADGSAGRDAGAIREALARSRASQFVIYDERRSLEAR